MSICIPTYDGARYLEECLESVRGQTFGDFEILIVDDQSSDESLSIARRHAVHDSRVRIERNPNRLGLAGNWNRCVQLARGDWIKFVFQDDLIDPLCVELLVEAGRRTRSSMIACFRRIELDGVDEETRQRYEVYSGKESLAGVFSGSMHISANAFCHAVLDHLKRNFVGEPTAVLLHRTVFQAYGGFNHNLVSMCDLEYWIRVGIHTGLAIVPEPLATFRVHRGGASAVLRRDNTYRLQRLDPLVLLHEFAFNEAFHPLRVAAASHDPAVDLKRIFVRQAVVARRAARSTSGSRQETRQRLEEWRAVAAQYPKARKGLAVRWRMFLAAIGWYRLIRTLHSYQRPAEHQR